MDDETKDFNSIAKAAAHLRSLGFRNDPSIGWVDGKGRSGSVTKVRDRWYACVYVEESEHD